MSKYAWVTLATNDAYSLGALVLAYSLKRVSTVHQLAVLITPGVSDAMRNKLKDVFNVVQEVNVMDSQDAANLALLARPELGITFTKIHSWRLIQFEKCVFLDADTLVLQNADELFEREELSAAPDVGWPDCFNSGVFVYQPSLDTFNKITQFALEKGSFDGGDQGLLNLYFSDWAHKDISKHLPFIYNTCSTATYSYLPAFKQFADRIKILHFIGQLKPWLLNFNSQTKAVQTPQEYGHLGGFLQLWWNIFCDNVHAKLTDEMGGLAGALSKLRLGEPRTAEQEAYEQHMRRQCWESGNIDYSGKDSFDNIWRKITQTLDNAPKPETSKQEKPGTRLTSDDIEDGKVEYDRATNAKIVYNKIKNPKGYTMTITTPQPNGTVKTETKTFYDPVPITEEELLKQQAEQAKSGHKPKATTVTKKIPGGREEITTYTNADGTTSVLTKTIYDAEEEEVTEHTQTTQSSPSKKTTKIVSTKVPGGTAFVPATTRKTNTEDHSTEEIKVKSSKTIEETRRVTETTEITGKSTKTSKRNDFQNISAITAVPDLNADKGNTTVSKKKVKGGTEYTYTTELEDGRTQTSKKLVSEQKGVELTDEEIAEYKRQLKEAEKHKNVTKTKNIKTETGTKQIVPSDNPGEVTTMETIKIPGGTEYHYTTIRADGTVKKSSKTVYDPTPVEGSEEEYEEIEEYEEEIIEPGEPIVETIQTTKLLTAEEKKKLGPDAIASKPAKKGKSGKSGKK